MCWSFSPGSFDHLPEPSQQLVRYWGWYRNAARGRRRRDEKGTTPRRHTEPGDEGTSRRLSWSQLIRKVYKIDPLLCPRCRSLMRVVSFITEPGLIRCILDHLTHSAEEGRAPPPSQPVQTPA